MPQRTTPSFKIYLSSLAQNLVSKLPVSPNIFTESKTASYFDNVKSGQTADRQRIEQTSVQVSVGFSK